MLSPSLHAQLARHRSERPEPLVETLVRLVRRVMGCPGLQPSTPISRSPPQNGARGLLAGKISLSASKEPLLPRTR